MRLGPDRRVRKRPEYQDIGARGARVATTHFVLLAALQAGAPRPSRLGITASRRVGNAVVRNRMKRLVREAFRQSSGLLPEGHDLVVICRQSGVLDPLGVRREWERALPRLLKMLATTRPGPAGGGSAGP
jgi:ribonuclease P protein component